MFRNTLFNTVQSNLDMGHWKLYEHSDILVWSDTFYTSLGYTKEAYTPSLDVFLEYFIHIDDHALFRDNFLNYSAHSIHFYQYIRIKNNQGVYRSFRCATPNEVALEITSDFKVLFFFEVEISEENVIEKDVFYYREAAQMTATGSWYVDFEKKGAIGIMKLDAY